MIFIQNLSMWTEDGGIIVQFYFFGYNIPVMTNSCFYTYSYTPLNINSIWISYNLLIFLFLLVLFSLIYFFKIKRYKRCKRNEQ